MVRLRFLARALMAIREFMYDLQRYVRRSGAVQDLSDSSIRNYHLVKVYHAIEKSIAFSNRRKGGGSGHARILLDSLTRGSMHVDSIGFHDYVSPILLRKYVTVEKALGSDTDFLEDGLASCEAPLLKRGQDKFGAADPGVEVRLLHQFRAGVLDDPEAFFLSRYSLREFAERPVDDAVLERAIKLAMKSPSVCNRQAWHLYHLDGESVTQAALALQSGNKGFGHKLRSLLIITVDLRAFVSPAERYQHWIDGGMFSMSLALALHSLGVASCCLNWSQYSRVDKALRRRVPIDDHHSVIMMMAFGYPQDANTVCRSIRRPLSEIYTRVSDRRV